MLDFRLFEPPLPLLFFLWVKDRYVYAGLYQESILLETLSSISRYLDRYAPRKGTDRRVRSALCRLILLQKGPERRNVVYLHGDIALLAFPFPL